MTRCSQISSTCNGLDIKPVLLYLRRNPRNLCAGCRSALERMGASFQVIEPAAPVRPRWLDRLTAVDHTGELAA